MQLHESAISLSSSHSAGHAENTISVFNAIIITFHPVPPRTQSHKKEDCIIWQSITTYVISCCQREEEPTNAVELQRKEVASSAMV